MSMFTRKMQMLTAVVMDEDKDKVVRKLLDKGVLDFVHLDSLDKDQMKKLLKHKASTNSQMIADLRFRIEGLFRQAGDKLPRLTSEDLESVADVDVDDIRLFLDKFSSSPTYSSLFSSLHRASWFPRTATRRPSACWFPPTKSAW